MASDWREYLEVADVPLDPTAALASPRLGEVCGRIASLAHGYFAEARAAMAECNQRAMRPARIARKWSGWRPKRSTIARSI